VRQFLRFLPYLLISTLHLFGHWVESEGIIFFTKPVLMPALLFGLWPLKMGKLGKALIAALSFSMLGDTFLLQSGYPFYFIAGLGCFLMTQVLYSMIFYWIRPRGMVWNGISVLGALGFLIYFTAFNFFLWEDLPHNFRIPVIVYGIAITVMGIMSVQLVNKVDLKGGIMILAGAMLFICSDSIIALSKFKTSFEMDNPGFWIMVTYLTGQWLITLGVKNGVNGYK